ncbi:MAG: ribosome biogenesis factor YjgA [Fluviibacter phosphoraccumulans]|jgi:ribosome-associated protein|uniref:ribosome biogenesis factor YjgA n=1 Tax=Fluviibacter phosphoraccumulans TaxID=1751046 RepID=UPI0024E2574B|nr:ribosome biogenesis factor YjgA [Fluviibacter phosphoraccumulans]
MPFHASKPPSHFHTRQGQEVVNAEPEPKTESRRPSKTKAKEEMDALQELGKRLVEVSNDRLKKLDIPEILADAVREAKRISSFGALRRQMQYIGKLMRDVDVEPIQEMLDEIDGVSNKANARFHALEKQRDKLLADESVITALKNQHPDLDVTALRTLRRNALKEQAEQKPPKAYRAIFQLLKSLEQANSTDAETPAEEDSDR